MTTIHSKVKESLVEAIRRAEKNAQCYGRVVSLSYQGIVGLVYPQEDLAKALKWFKIEILKRDIALLETPA